MRAVDIVRAFADKEDVPVKINDVANAIISNGFQDEIHYVAVEMKEDILRGMLIRRIERRSVYGEPQFVSYVYYDRTLSEPWRRLVCCKELLHIVDDPQLVVKSREEVEALIEKIVLPPTFQTMLEQGLHASQDRINIIFAAAVLFPIASRDLLLPHYENGAIDIEAISQLVNLPPEFVQMVMSKHWPKLYGIMAS